MYNVFMKNNQQQTWLMIGFLSFLVVFNIWMITTGARPWIVSSLNILFHEAGHWIFGIFGRFIGVLGGTLGELLMPLMFFGYFHFKQQMDGKIFSLWWLTTALYNVSIYVADARAQVLPLIGGPGGHDWFYLLGRTRLLDHDIFISKLFIIIALCITVYMTILIHRYWKLSMSKEVL